MSESSVITPKLQLVAWEITRGCNLLCVHCRAASDGVRYSGELSTAECFGVIDQILDIGKPILILSGGEPLVRQDVYEIGRYAVSKGLRVVMGSNGTLVTGEVAARLKEIPLSRLSVSLDFTKPELQDKFRGQTGAYAAAMTGIANARKAGIEIQINSTITKLNVGYLGELLSLAQSVGAVAFHPFLLVPTGRGKGLESVALSPQEYENTLNWIYDRKKELGDSIFFKPTCSPHFLRVTKQRARQEHMAEPASKPALSHGHQPLHSITRGCLAGTGFAFISHRGDVQGCGYFTLPAGNIREQSFTQIWNDSPLFRCLRDLDNYKGKCGICEYKRICGGCRARAYEETGDYLEGEPYCIYEPSARVQSAVKCETKGESMPVGSISKKLLNLLQTEFPLLPAPYRALGEKLGVDGDGVIEYLKELKAQGIIRQIGPVIDARRLGYQSTLVAMKVASAQLDQAARLIVDHSGVSHAYERDHNFNLWFTLAIPPTADVETQLKYLNSRIGAEAVFALPAIKLFKIQANFAVDEDLSLAAVGMQSDGALPTEAALSDRDRRVINEIQQDLPLVPAPFDAMAENLGMSTADFLAQCRSLLERGIIRRFSASVNHRKVGFTANAMTCWAAPPEAVDIVGQRLAALGEVSHCYERRTNASWPYNLFAMIHGHDKETCRQIADRVSKETGFGNYVSLFSTREFKKTRIKYTV